MTPRLLLAVAAFGAVGSALRYLVAQLVPRTLGFPWGTLLVNVLGCLFIGLLAELSGRHFSPRLITALTSGLLGGFTTFSAFALETTRLGLDGKLGHAALYVTASLAGGLVAVLVGQSLGRLAG